MKAENRLRQADFKSAIILSVISLVIFVETLNFPMSGSFGGVENQWYVSPALFPLVIISVLMVCALLLLVTALKARGCMEFFSLSRWLGDHRQRINRDRWYVILLLCLYVYIYIPSMDFYLASVMFLLSLTARFYFAASSESRAIFVIHGLLVISLFVFRLVFLENFYVLSLEAASEEKLVLCSDFACLAAVLAMLFLVVKTHYQSEPRKVAHTLVCCLAIPLFIVIVFSFLLYVPMPVELGLVSELMSTIAYDFLGL